MKRPFLGIGISSVIGIVISYYLKVDMIISLALFFIFFLVYVITIYIDKNNSLFILILSMLIGMSIASYKLNRSVLIKNIEIPINARGVIEKIVSQDENQNKYILKISSLGIGGNQRPINEKTMLKIIGSSNIELGDKIEFQGIFKTPMTNTNPKLYNYRENLISKDIYTSINIKANEILELDKSSRSFKYKMRSSFRSKVESTFDKYLDKDNSDLLKGIVLGDYNYLDEEYLKTYRDIGLAHILAVSGLHIGIIAGAIVFFMSRIGLNRKWNTIITISIIWIYAYLIGFPSSILRANIMFSLLFIGFLMAEPYDSINALFLSFLILILSNPLSILSVGFQLSYAATFSILYFTPRIRKAFYYFENNKRYKKNLISTVSALVGLYIGILPIQIYYFNEFSPMSIVSNILIAPIISFVLVGSFILLIVESIFSPLNIVLGFVINTGLNIERLLVGIIYRFNSLNFKIGSPNIFQIFLYYVLIFIIFRVIDFSTFKKNVIKSIYIYLIFFLIFSLGFEINDNSLEIDFIDVGQGDAALIRTRSGDYLVDTGGEVFGDFDICKNITLPYLEKHGIKKLKGVFITHFHLDHCKGIPILAENLHIENIFISYENSESEIYNYILNSKIPLVLLKAGDNFHIDKNTSINIISPKSSYIDMAYSENNLSLVFDISYYNRKILFTGDAEVEIERDIEDELNKVDILKVGHHGSSTSSTEGFLNRIKPDLALISVGRNNRHRHPHEDVIQRLNALDVHIYRTDNNGMTKVKLNKEKLYVTAFLQERDILKDSYLYIIFFLIYYLISYIFIRSYVTLEEELNIIEI